MTELLLQHGACVNVADLWKFTPLHEAAAKGKYEICKLLLKVRKLSVSSNLACVFNTLLISYSKHLNSMIFHCSQL